MKMILIAMVAIVLLSLAFIGGGIGLAAAQGGDSPAQTFAARLAAKLGIGEDELRSAIAEVQQETVDERVAQGSLTPEQGERLKERIEQGGPLRPGALHRMRKAVCERGGKLLLGSAATVLDMEPKELLSEMRGGNTLAQVAEEQGMPVDELAAALLDQTGEKLDALVAEGKLTEQQASAISERMENNVDRIVSAPPGALARHCRTR